MEPDYEATPVPKKKKKARKPVVKKIDKNTKTYKYFKSHVLDGKTKTVAAKEAGISHVNNTTNIERTKTFQALTEKYADSIQRVISMDEVAVEHTKNIIQDQDRGAKNAAIKMFLERVEPEAHKKEEEDKLIIVLR